MKIGKKTPEPEPTPEPTPEPSKEVGTAAGTYLTGVCATCDSVWATFISWFGDPMYEPELQVVHNANGSHSPWVVSTGRKFAQYADLRAVGWKPLVER